MNFELELREQHYKSCVRHDYVYPYELRYREKGNAIGTAHTEDGKAIFTFSKEAIRLYPEYMVERCIAHELAHMVGWKLYGLTGHCRTWKRLCLAHGGNGKQYHTLDVTPARVTRSFLYRLPSGREIELGCIRHNRIMKGSYKYRVGDEPILTEHFVKEIYDGRP